MSTTDDIERLQAALAASLGLLAAAVAERDRLSAHIAALTDRCPRST